MKSFILFFFIYIIFFKRQITCEDKSILNSKIFVSETKLSSDDGLGMKNENFNLPDEKTSKDKFMLDSKAKFLYKTEVSTLDNKNTDEEVRILIIEPTPESIDVNLDTLSVKNSEKTPQELVPSIPTDGTSITVSPAPNSNVDSYYSLDASSALLKNILGLKIDGACGTTFIVNFVPHLLFTFETKSNKIRLEQKFTASETIDIIFNNTCEVGNKFKYLVYIHEGVLTIKFELLNESDPKKEKKRFKLPKFERPITALQVHIGKSDGSLIESKNYVIKNTLPESCSLLSNDCFLGGSLNLDACYHCSLIAKGANHNSECFNYVSSQDKIKYEDEIKTEAQDDENLDEKRLENSIEYILRKIYKKNKNGTRELIKLKDLDKSLREEIINYCNLLKNIDASGIMDNYQLGTVKDVFNNIVRLLSSHDIENDYTIPNKLKQSAICILDVNAWIINKRGLLLPKSLNGGYDHRKNIANDDQKYIYDNEIKITDDMFEKDENNLIDLTKNIKNIQLRSPYFASDKYCNDEYCNRWKDRTSCISKIDVEDQGNCSVCWVFASKLHLETIRCMRGYGYYKTSSLFVANCSNRTSLLKCLKGSNPIEYLEILNEHKFLPLDSDFPYNYVYVGNQCPLHNKKWSNLWGNPQMLTFSNDERTEYTKGFAHYSSEDFKDNIDMYIKIIKQEVQNKGSVIAYIKAHNVFTYDFNGKGVHNICGSEIPDHAANIIGYGNYINFLGQKRFYWIIRNSWGYYWGDEGNFRVDAHGPDNCQYNYIYAISVFKINLDDVKAPSVEKSSNRTKKLLLSSSHFYHLYYKNFDVSKNHASSYSSIDKKHVINKEHSLNRNQLVYGVDEGEEEKPEYTDHKELDSSHIANDVSSAQGTHINSNIYHNVTFTYDTAKVPYPKVKIHHILKNIKNKRVRKGVVIYSDPNAIEDAYSCARAYSNTRGNDYECKEFCVQNLDKCKDKYLIGICLLKLKGNNDCNFCHV